MFITFEGGEGVGKTTQIEAVAAWLKARGQAVVTTREPGGTPLAEAIRQWVKTTDEPMPAMTELLLMFAARTAHVDTVIAPALADGKIVLCDRFTDASFAYQGGGRGLAMHYLDTLQSWLPAAAQPDLTLLLDAPVTVGMTRARQRGAADRFEQEKTAFFERVRHAYHQRAAAEPARFVVIDIEGKTPAQVTATITDAIAAAQQYNAGGDA